jgi:hypothetical protein
MANVQHSALTGSDLHEPKGASTATSGTTYVSNGSGSGTWTFPEPKGVSGASSGKVYVANGSGSGSWSYPVDYITVELTDISTPSSCYVVAPYAGTISKIYSVIDGAITGANATITPSIGGVSITSGGITIAQSGSAAGDVDSSTPSAANAVTAGQAIKIETDGASTNTVKAQFTIVIQRT